MPLNRRPGTFQKGASEAWMRDCGDETETQDRENCVFPSGSGEPFPGRFADQTGVGPRRKASSLSAFSQVGCAICQARANRAAGAQEPDPDRGWGNALLPCNLLRGPAIHLFLKERSVAGTAVAENLRRVQKGQIDSGLAAEFRQRLIAGFFLAPAPMVVEGNRVHPIHDRAFVAKLIQLLQAPQPGCLSELLGAIHRSATRAQEANRSSI